MKTFHRALVVLIVCTIFTVAGIDCANAVPAQISTFNSLNMQIIGGVPPGSYLYFNEPVEFEITNNTGVTWTDFHGGTFTGGFVVPTYDGPGVAAYTNTWTVPPVGPFPGYTNAGGLDITEINIPTSGILDFTVNLAIGPSESAGFLGILVSGTPSTGVTGEVPEPATMLLLGSGLIGLAGFARKKFFKK